MSIVDEEDMLQLVTSAKNDASNEIQIVSIWKDVRAYGKGR